MNHVVATVAPVFSLIALGYLARISGLLQPGTGRGLADFVFTIAMPALLFRTMAGMTLPAGLPVALLAAFFGAMGFSWVLASLASRFTLHRPGIDSAPIAMGAVFGNTVMMGIPLALGHFGEVAAAPLALLIAFHAPLLWLVATFQHESITRGSDAAWGHLIASLARDLARNPILVGIIAGLAWRQTGLAIGPIPDRVLSLLGQAAVPSALFGLGMSLVGFNIKGHLATIVTITFLKLIVSPLVAWVLAVQVFALDPVWAGVVMILAACPTGANAYLFASRYDRAVGSVSGSIAIGTAISLLTISVLLAGL